MNISQLKVALMHEIEKHHEAVLNPDHPYLVDGPDILVGGVNGLVGIFVMRYSETKHPDDLLMRMAVSRIAYPTNFRAVLIASPYFLRLDSEDRRVMNSSFDAVNDWKDYRKLRSHLNAENRRRNEANHLDALRQTTFLQTQILYSATLEGRHQSQGRFTPSDCLQRIVAPINGAYPRRQWAVTRSRVMEEVSRDGDWYLGNNCFVGMSVTFETNRFARRVLSEFARDVFELDHVLDNGIPYRRRSALNVLLVDRLPQYPNDPDKWLRSASFAGYAMLVATEPDQVENKLKTIKERMEDLA